MSKLLLLVEILGFLTLVAGVALVSVPFGLVVLGGGVIAVCEIHGATGGGSP